MQIDQNSSISREDAQCALSVYINIKPDEQREKSLKWKYLNPQNRDIRDPSNKRIIIPDSKLSKLLGYEEYKDKVQNGEIYINSKKLGQKVLVEDDKMEYYVMISLMQKLFLK